MTYKESQKQADFQNGDVVKLLRHPISYESGWGDSWDESLSKRFPEGEEYEVFFVHEELGIQIEKKNGGYAYVPYFCLQLISKNPRVEKGQVWRFSSTWGESDYLIAHCGRGFKIICLRFGNRWDDEDRDRDDVQKFLRAKRATYLGDIRDLYKQP